jgi:hypothetical protein
MSGESSSSTIDELRALALTAPPADFGIQPEAGRAWAVVMDTTYPEGSVSLLALSDGSASLYLSTGGGMIGGQGHEHVAAAARAFVGEATRHLDRFIPAGETSLPPPGVTCFYVRTEKGTVTAEAAEADLGAGNDPLSPLFYAGHEVITQFRAVAGSGPGP